MLPHLFAHGRTAMLFGLCGIGLLSAAAGVAVAHGVADLFTAVLDPDRPHGDMRLGLTLLPAAAMLLILLQVAERMLAEHLGQHYVVELREAIFDRLYGLADSDRARLRQGHLMTRFTADLTAIRAWVARGVAAALTGSVMLTGLLAYLAIRHPLFAATVGLLVMVLLVVVTLLGPALSERILAARRRRARLSGFMGERVTAMSGIRAMRAGRRDRRRLGRLSRRLGSAMVIREGWSEAVRALPTASSLLAPALCVIAAVSWLPVRPDPAELILVMTVAGLTTRPLLQLSQAFVQRSNYRVARRMLLALFELPVQPTRRSGGRTLRAGPVAVTIDRLRLSPIAQPLTASAGPAERILVNGPPGSGKTRLLRMLAGFERVPRARVTVNGRDVAVIARESLHRVARLFTGDLPLLKGSLRRNLGLQGAARRQVLPLLRRCGVIPAMLSADQVDAFRLSEGGANASTSLRQRLLLARALGGDPGLLLVDDFDQIKDEVVRARLSELWRNAQGITLIVVSESKELGRTADQCWRLDYRNGSDARSLAAEPPKESIDDAA